MTEDHDIGRKSTNSSGDDNDAASDAQNNEICNEMKDGVVTGQLLNYTIPLMTMFPKSYIQAQVIVS